MSSIQLRDSVLIGDNNKPYYIAEVNSSHNGKVETAKQMVDAAIEAGCSCVKFQSWTPESLYSKSYYEANPISKRIIKKFSMSSVDLLEIANYCQEKGIDFSSTPYSKSEVDFLVDECKVPFIKISSMEITNYQFLKYIAMKNIPMILSTGMSSYEEIDMAVKCIESTGNKQLIVLHCVSLYPADCGTINLKNISKLREFYPSYPIGYSDHTIGTAVAVGAIVLGASVIEKHLTLDNKKMGMDNNMATEPDELSKMVIQCNSVFSALGSRERIVTKEEEVQKLKMRRSIVALVDIEENEIITEDMITGKRPGNGIPIGRIKSVIGKCAKHKIEKDTLLYYEDLM